MHAPQLSVKNSFPLFNFWNAYGFKDLAVQGRHCYCVLFLLDSQLLHFLHDYNFNKFIGEDL